MKKLEYEELVLITLCHNGFSETNYLYSMADLNLAAPQMYEKLQSGDEAWKESLFTSQKSIAIKRCRDIHDFNNFVTGKYNSNREESSCYAENKFYTGDDGGLICKDLFGGEEHIYYFHR